MAAAAVYEAVPYGDKLSSTNSKDWFTQTEITKQTSTDVMTQYENQRFLWEEIDKLDIHSCDSESQTDLRGLLQNFVDSSTQKGFIAADNYTQHEIKVTDSATQKHNATFDHPESFGDGIEVGVQKELVLANKETQRDVKGVDAGIQHEAACEDKETHVDSEVFEANKGKSYNDVYIQAAGSEFILVSKSKSCQCLSCGKIRIESVEQEIQTNETNRMVSTGLQVVQESADVNTQNRQVLSSMRTQTASTDVKDQSIQTVFSPYSRELAGENDIRLGKMEASMQTVSEPVSQADAASQHEIQNTKNVGMNTSEEKISRKLTESFAQCNYPISGTQDGQTDVNDLSDGYSVSKRTEASTSFENLRIALDSNTQYESCCIDSATMTPLEKIQMIDSATSGKQVLLIESFTQTEYFKVKSTDKPTQYESSYLFNDSVTQYDLNDFYDDLNGSKSNGLRTSVSTSISATRIRENLVQEELNNSKVSFLRDRVEDCLQNWPRHPPGQPSQIGTKEKSDITSHCYEEESACPSPFCFDGEHSPSEFGNDAMRPQVRIDKHSFGDAAVTTVRAKRSKKPAGSRKFCIIM